MSQQNPLPNLVQAEAMRDGINANVQPTTEQMSFWHGVDDWSGGATKTMQWTWQWPTDVKLARLAILNQLIGAF